MKVYETLIQYAKEDRLAMHMPGHKRNPHFFMENPYQLDVTEVPGLDDLHRPSGMFLELKKHLAKCYGSYRTDLLVNGSTSGILAAMTTCCQPGDAILVARNCHKSVYHGIRLLQLNPVFIYPSEVGGAREELGIAGIISPDSVREALAKNANIRCVILTSPTYEGVVSPIGEISKIVHEKNIPLIVDEAHGAHFHWHETFPRTALQEGADFVIESLHKTLPSFTQTAVLHWNGLRAREEDLQWSLQTYQSSSPSYILMAGMERCFAYIEKEGATAFPRYVDNLKKFRESMRNLQHLWLFESPQKEPSKIVIVTNHTNWTGADLAQILEEDFGIVTEMSCGDYCLAMTSICDVDESFQCLADALLSLDACSTPRNEVETNAFRYVWQAPEQVLTSALVARKVRDYPENECQELIPVEDAFGRIAAQDIVPYPPGIPLIVQGERFSKETTEVLSLAAQAGREIDGLKQGKVFVLK